MSEMKSSSLWSDAWVRLRKNKLATASLFLIIVILLMCFVVRWFLPHEPNAADLGAKFLSAGEGGHLLGTDQLGRDLLARMLDGGQISLLIALLATTLTVMMGVIYGSIAGYVGGWVENLMMRVVDGLLALPFLVIVILMRELIAGWIDSGAETLIARGAKPDLVLRFANIIPLIFAIAAFGWLTMGRIVCTQAANLVRMEYIEAARSLGLTHWTILKRHIIPNLLGTVIIYATLTIPSFILYEATLSFIGMGIEPPNSSWGMLIKDGANLIETQPALLYFPAILFSLTLFGFNFLGDGLRDALDPKAAKD